MSNYVLREDSQTSGTTN